MNTLAETLGAEPAAVFAPRSVQELADTMSEAVATGHAIVPNGGGTAQDFGYRVRAESVAVINMSSLSRIVAVEPGDLTITVEAGATLAQVQAALLQHGLFLPLDAPHPERATVGGILATDAFGASRLGYGTARDWCIGLTVVGANGAITKSGGKVVKNVTGYDLPKLHIGALGTLGIIAEATFKALPLPEATATVVVTLQESQWHTPGAFVADVLEETAPIQAYRRLDATGDYLVFVFQGFVEVVRQEAQKVETAAEELARGGATIRAYDTLLETPDAEPFSFVMRFTGDAARDNERHEAIAPYALYDFLPEQASDNVATTFLGTGVTELSCVRDAAVPIEQARSILYAQGHRITRTLLHASLALRDKVLPVWHPEPASLPLMRRLKNAVDPENILNPGRFVGRI